LNYTSQDFGRYDGEGNGKGLQTGKWEQSRLDIESDITQIPEPDSSFDAVMCIEVLEHLPQPVDALRELCRLLKPGGVLILSAPFCSLTHMAPYFYQTGYSRYFYEYWLKELGVSIVEMQWNGNFFEYLAQELRRLPAVAAQYSKEALSETEQKAQDILLGALNRLSKADHGSEQFLSYGLHVVAQKR
jgi:ubiquinone/menaquinone biosynthesis C-methylase UbiE